MSLRSVLTLGGAIIGSFFGAPQLGFVIGSLVGNAVDPVKVYGPRLSDAKVQTARDGVPIPWGAGRFRTAGTIIAVQPNGPTEHEETEGGKGGGPEQVTYTYTYTHAILVCEGPIIGIRRIWRDQKLVYDRSTEPTEEEFDLEASGVSFAALIQQWKAGLASSSSFAERITIYLGDESQLPDPELEAIFGVGNVPAHRGMAYVVFKDDDVTDRQGSIPNYEFEVIKAGSTEDYTELPIAPLFHYKMDDASSGTMLDSSGNGYHGNYGGDYASATGIFPNSSGSTQFVTRTGYAVAYGALPDPGDSGIWSCEASFRIDSKAADGVTPALHGATFKSIFAAWGSEQFDLYSYAFRLDRTSNMQGNGGYTKTNQDWILAQDADILELDTDYHVLVTKGSAGIFIYVNGQETARLETSDAQATGTNLAWNRGRFVMGSELYPANHGFVGRVENVAIYPLQFTAQQARNLYFARAYSQVPGGTGWVLDDDGNYIFAGTNVTLLDPAGVSLADFLDEICARSNLDVDMFDTSTIPDNLEGFIVARETDGSALITALAQGFFFDAAEWDGKVRFIQRGGASVATLDADDLVAQDGAPVRETIDQEIERPRKINVNYFDPALYYVPTKQTAERRSGSVAAIGERTIELPIVFSKDTAAQVADKQIKVSWTDQLGTVEFDLPSAFSYLTPTDIVTLTYRERTQRVRIEKIEDENGRLLISARQDRLSAYESNATGTGSPQTPPYPAPPGATVFMAMNLPALRSQDSTTPGVYLVACGVLANWPGCVVQISYDGGASFTTLVTMTNASVIGTLAATATDPAFSPVSEIITVQVYGSIESVTPTQIAAGANAFAIVDALDVAEVGQVQTVVASTGTGNFDLMDPLRGLLATEAVEHASGERFAMLGNALFVPIDSDYAGSTLIFRPVTIGTTAESATQYELVFDPQDTVIDAGEIT